MGIRLLTVMVLVLSITTMQFPHILWTFWGGGYENAKIFTKLCINNMDYYAKLSNWEFRFVTQSNVTNYISKEGQQKINTLKGLFHGGIGIQHLSDLYRLFLIYQNGGMWLDTNSMLVGDLSWVDNIDKYSSTYNRLSENADLITFSYNDIFGGNKTWAADEATDRYIYLFPGVQIWSFIAKPNSTFLHDVIQNLEYSLRTPMHQLVAQNIQQGILYDLENNPYHILSNYQFQTILQKKQKDIEANPNKYTTKYSVDYYKMWSINALSSAFAIFELSDWKGDPIIDLLFYGNMDELSQKNKVDKYFLKFTSRYSGNLNSLIPNLQFLFCSQGIEIISKQSIIYQYLFKPSLSMPIIKRIADTIQKPTAQQCSFIQQSTFKRLILFAIAAVLVLLVVNCLLFKLVKSANYGPAQQLFNKVPTNDL